MHGNVMNNLWSWAGLESYTNYIYAWFFTVFATIIMFLLQLCQIWFGSLCQISMMTLNLYKILDVERIIKVKDCSPAQDLLLYYLIELLGGTIRWWRLIAILYMATRAHTHALCCNVLWSTTGGSSQHNFALLSYRRWYTRIHGH